jgi:hypothetical protein
MCRGPARAACRPAPTPVPGASHGVRRTRGNTARRAPTAHRTCCIAARRMSPREGRRPKCSPAVRSIAFSGRCDYSITACSQLHRYARRYYEASR